jgi:hypothetical protein
MPNKKFWDNSSLQTDPTWDNRPVSGLSDEELHSTNWNLKKTKADKEKARERSNALLEDPDWQFKQQQGQEQRAKSNWSEKMKGNKNGLGKKRTKKIVQPEYANKSRSEKLMGRKIPSITGVPKPKVTCPHCGKEGGRPQMIQYHFDKCKAKK